MNLSQHKATQLRRRSEVSVEQLVAQTVGGKWHIYRALKQLYKSRYQHLIFSRKTSEKRGVDVKKDDTARNVKYVYIILKNRVLITHNTILEVNISY